MKRTTLSLTLLTGIRLCLDAIATVGAAFVLWAPIAAVIRGADYVYYGILLRLAPLLMATGMAMLLCILWWTTGKALARKKAGWRTACVALLIGSCAFVFLALLTRYSINTDFLMFYVVGYAASLLGIIGMWITVSIAFAIERRRARGT